MIPVISKLIKYFFSVNFKFDFSGFWNIPSRLSFQQPGGQIPFRGSPNLYQPNQAWIGRRIRPLDSRSRCECQFQQANRPGKVTKTASKYTSYVNKFQTSTTELLYVLNSDFQKIYIFEKF
jgi:hypothetical protein